MKITRKITSLLLALVMCIYLCVPAFALTVNSETDVVYSQSELQDIQDYNKIIEEYMRVREKMKAGDQKLLSIPCVKQIDSSHCAPACAVMATKYLGLKANDGSDYTQKTIEPIINYRGTNGTYSPDIATGINKLIGSDIYQFVNTGKQSEIPKASLWGSLVTGIDHNYPMFINIRKMPNYPKPVGSGHFILGVGYYWALTGASSNSKVTYNDPREGYANQYTITIQEMVDACNSNVGNFVRAAV